MIKRLRIKFICINMTIVTVMLLVILGLILHFTRRNLEDQSIRILRILTEDRTPVGHIRNNSEEIRIPYLLVEVDFQGNVLAMSGGHNDMPEDEQLTVLVAKILEQEEITGVLEEYGLRYRRKETPFGQKLAVVDIASKQETLRSLTRICMEIWLVSYIVFFAISVLLARWAVRPVEIAWNQQRQFVADASHELKTPLTVIMTNAELIQTQEYDPQRHTQFAESILTMSRQMRGLVEGMLELARVDNRSDKMVFSQVDLSELISEGMLPFEPVYFEKGLQLDSRIEEGLQVRGSRAHLQHVLDILLDNAAKYSDPNGLVTVTLTRQGSHCVLAVSNPGAPISKENLKNIFKRFYRIDKARAMNHSYGLGLAIAESIVQEHGGKIWAESSGGYNTFFVQLGAV